MSQSGRVCGLTNTFCLREPTAALLLDRFVYNSMLYKWMAFLPIVAFKALMWSSVSVRTLFVSYILCRFTLNDSDGANKKYFLFKSTTVQICQTKSAFDVNFSLLKLHFFFHVRSIVVAADVVAKLFRGRRSMCVLNGAKSAQHVTNQVKYHPIDTTRLEFKWRTNFQSTISVTSNDVQFFLSLSLVLSV